MVDTLEVEFSSVFELEPDGKSLTLTNGFGWRPGSLGHSFPLNATADSVPNGKSLSDDVVITNVEDEAGRNGRVCCGTTELLRG